MIHVVAVDRVTLDDLMAWQTIGRALAERPPGAGHVVLVHVPGESVDRTLEGSGMDLRAGGGLLRSTDPASSEALGRAARSENRRIVTLLTEEGLPAVGFLGGDRGLLGQHAPPPWLEAVVRAGSIPVVASVAPDRDGMREMALAESTAWLSGLPGAVPVLLARGKPGPRGVLDPCDPGTADRLAESGISAMLSTVSGLSRLRSDS